MAVTGFWFNPNIHPYTEYQARKSTLEKYAGKAGLTKSYDVNGIPTAAGSVDLSGATDNDLAWAGVGQYHDSVNPCALMIYMGAIANGGKAVQPTLIQKVVSPGLPTLPIDYE